MSYWLARLGRWKHAQLIAPGICAAFSAGYLTYHMFGTPIVRKIFCVYDGKQERPIGPHVRGIIDEVMKSTKDTIWMPVMQDGSKISHPINWFLSTSLDPIHAGLTESRNGAVVGVPLHFEYENHSDIPDKPVTYARANFLRKKESTDSDEDARLEREILKSMSDGLDQTSIERHSVNANTNNPASRQFAESLLLSDDARRFALARELFYVDGYQVMFNFFAITLFGLTGITASRLAVQRFNLRQKHLSSRLFVYQFVTVVVGLQAYLYRNVLQCFYDYRADERAAELGKQYMNGGIEYYTKMLNRNKAMRDLIDDQEIKKRVNKDGDINYGFWSRRQAPLNVRLQTLLDLQKQKTAEINKFS